MAHFAKIENDIVTNVIVIDNSIEEYGQEFINNTLGLEGEWIQTSINNNFRGVFACIGFLYNRELDKFIPQQPFPSWVLNSEWYWEAPIPHPNDGLTYLWNEDSLLWEELIN